MIEVEAGEKGIRAVDATKTSVRIRTDRWEPASEEHAFPVAVDGAVAGTTTELRLPPGMARVDRVGGDPVATLGAESGPVELPAADYLLHVETNVRARLRFTGAATVRTPPSGEVVVSFPEPTAVTVGFESRAEALPETITVPSSPEGVARAITALSAAHETTTPDRTFPTQRRHPPLIELGDAVDVPRSVQGRRADTGIRFELPPDLAYLFPAAPLAYYLGAEVTVAEGADPRLAGAVDHALPSQPGFQRATAALLRRIFLLDSLVRCAGPRGVGLAEGRHLDALGLDAAALYEAPVAERLTRYLDAPFERVSESLPEWHLSVSVEPIAEHVPSLSHHLHRLANVVLAEAVPLSSRERLSRSLDDFYRGPTVESEEAGEAVAVDLLKPSLGPGRWHGWLADGAPIDVYRSLPEAYEHRFDFRDRAGEPFSIVAVLNDTGMADEHARAAEIYRERADELDIDIAVRQDVPREELAAVFESHTDLVHYVGHCEQAGLRCPDGHLSLSTLRESNAQVFFLNACGSYYEGLELVRKGSVAGAVTFNEVLDQQAARVGTTFARLLVNGFSIERALGLARRQIMMGKDYTVVGDGTHVLTQAKTVLPAAIELTERGEDDFELRFDYSFPYVTGGQFQVPGDGGAWHLFGSDPTRSVDRAELRATLERADCPIIFDGRVAWPEDLRERFEG